MGAQRINTHVISAFLRFITSECDSKEIESMPSFLIADILQKNCGTPSLATSLRKRLLLFNNDLVLVPCYDMERDHWSMAGLFPKQKVLAHCDSLPDKSGDLKICDALLLYIAKVNIS